MSKLYEQYLARAAARRLKALLMHERGDSDSVIAEKLGVSRQRAWKMVETARREKAKA
jgi:biotin operon repressor